MSLSRASFADLQVAYKELSEEKKRSLFKVLSKTEPVFFYDWMKLADLKGCRPQSVADRRLEKFAAKLDNAITCDGNEKFLVFVVKTFLFGKSSLFCEKLTSLLSARTKSSENAEQFLSRLKRDLSPLDGWPLFEAYVKLHPFEFVSPDDAVVEESRAGADGEELECQSRSGWEVEIAHLRSNSDELKILVERIASAQHVDETEVTSKLRQLLENARSIRSELLLKSEKNGFEEELWVDFDSLRKFATELSEKILTNEDLKRKQAEVAGFGVFLKSLSINHRVPRHKRRLEDLLVAAVQELEESAKSLSPSTLPGPSADFERLRWMLGRSGPESERMRESLTVLKLLALAEFCENCEIGEVVSGNLETNCNQIGDYGVASDSNLEKGPIREENADGGDASVSSNRPPQPVGSREQHLDASICTVDNISRFDVELNDSEDVSKREATESGTSIAFTGTNVGGIADDCVLNPCTLANDGSEEKGEILHEPLLATVPDLDVECEDLVAVLWRMVAQRQFGYAYQCALALSSRNHGLYGFIPSVVRIGALGIEVQCETGEIFRYLHDDYKTIVSLTEADSRNGDRDRSIALELVLTAGSLRPALLAPRSGASAFLRDIDLGSHFPNIKELAKPIWEFADRGLPLTPEALEGVTSKANLEEKMATLRQDVERWWLMADKAAFITRPGTLTWRHMLASEGIISKLISPIRQNVCTIEIVKEIKSLCEKYRDESIFEDEARHIFSQVLGHRGHLVQGAAKKITRLGMEATQIARRWAVLCQLQLDGVRGFSHKHAEELRREFEKSSTVALAELGDLSRDSSRPMLASAAAYAIAAIEDARSLLKGEVQKSESPVHFILNADLLRFPEIQLDDDWMPKQTSDNVVKILKTSFAKGKIPDWLEAFALQTEKRDHEATSRILEVLESIGELETDELRNRQDKQIKLCRDALKREVQEARLKLDYSMRQGLFSRVDFEEANSEIDCIEKSESLNFAEGRARLDLIDRLMSERAEEHRNLVRRRLDLLSDSVGEETIKAIREALDLGDVISANDYIERAERGVQLPEAPSGRSSFTEFFKGSPESPCAFESLLRGLNESTPASIVGAAQNRTATLGIDFKAMSADQMDKTASAVKAWFSVKEQKKLSEDNCRAILVGLGFNVYKTETRRKGEQYWLDVTTEPVDQCPVASFGSEARGRYRVFSAFNETMETISKIASAQDFQRHSSIILYFGNIEMKRRRDLSVICRQRSVSPIVVDTVLFVHVASTIGTGTRLPLLFELALPFSKVQPYVTTAGRMPPEIFCGRQREIEELISPTGSCFVYGGRQLGKTALLRHVEEQFTDVRSGQIACWLDLKHHGLHSVDDIWPVLANIFGKYEILPHSASRQIVLETLLDHIRTWLEVDQRRRILLLLDEADHFLKIDGSDSNSKVAFSRCIQLRGLMDITQKRFKVVFAGLHNVQRTTRVANHPLAHYGQPLCIGPLLNGGIDAEEARRLVEAPLATAGYVFDSQYPVIHILAQSNYYPSLIQVYCQRLLRHAIANVRHFDVRNSPPYVLTLRHVEDAYNSLELQATIAEKFRLTLDLDPRYRLIAIVIAFNTREDEQGFTPMRLKSEAFGWWKRGFDSATDEEFVELLEEMVGLGVLRNSPSHSHYFLRNPNLIPMLGGADEIETELANFSNREPEPEFDPAHYRRPLRPTELSERSPLSVAHESELRSLQHDSVFIFVGTEAAEISKMRRAIEAIFPRERLNIVSNLRSVQTFSEKLKEVSARAGSGANLVLVTPETDWEEAWLRAALERTQRREAEVSRLGVVFLALPDLAWRQLEVLKKICREGEVHLRTLRPWNDAALRQWLEECQFGPRDYDGRQRLFKDTGNWQFLLREIYQSSREGDWKAAVTDVRIAQYPQMEKLFGCEDRNVARILRIWGQLGDVPTARDLSLLCSDDAEEFVEKVFVWAQIVGIAACTEESWVLDPFLSRFLENPESF